MRSAVPNADQSFIRTRRRKSIVRMTTGEVSILNRNLTSWATRSAPVVEEPLGKALRQLQPRCQQCRDEGIRQEIRAWQLRCRVDKRIDNLARMFNSIIEADELLWSVLQVDALPDTTPSRPMSRAMGDVEIQTSAATSKTGRALGKGKCLPHPHAVGPLADAAQDGGWTVRAG